MRLWLYGIYWNLMTQRDGHTRNFHDKGRKGNLTFLPAELWDRRAGRSELSIDLHRYSLNMQPRWQQRSCRNGWVHRQKMLKEIHLCVIYDEIKKYGGIHTQCRQGLCSVPVPTKTWTMLCNKANSYILFLSRSQTKYGSKRAVVVTEYKAPLVDSEMHYSASPLIKKA